MKGQTIIILLLTVLLLSLTACTEMTQTQEHDFDHPALIINGEEVSVAELRTIYATYVPDRPVAKEVLLDTVIADVVNYRLLLQEARKKGYVVSQEEIDEAFKAFLAQQRMTKDEFETSLEGTGTTIDDYRTRISEDLLVNKLLLELNMEASENEVASYYAENIAAFMVPDQVVIRQITLSPDLTREELTEKTQLIMDGVRAGQFCEMAEEYSLDKTCNSYGISKGDAFPALEQAAFTQQIGDITLVQGEDGYYFVETINKLDYNPVPLTEVQTTIATSIGAAKFEKAYADFIATLREQATIENFIQ